MESSLPVFGPAEQQWHDFSVAQWREAAIAHGAESGIRAALQRIRTRDSLINAFSTVLDAQALESARRLDLSMASRGDHHQRNAQVGPLFGVPIAIKEEVDVAGTVTTFGTNANSTKRCKDAEIVSRLRRAGAIIIGKTTMPAFGAFPFTESEATGITRNPYDLSRTPGGSSGGTAAAIAAGMVPAAIGGDGGGSVRIPAAHCGLVGLKPGRGVLPTDPYPDLWLSLGTAGPLGKCVQDVSLVYDALLGRDTHLPLGSRSSHERPLRVAFDLHPVSPFTPPHREHVAAVHRVVGELERAGHGVEKKQFRYPDPTPAFLVQFYAGIREEIARLDHPEWIEPRHKRTALMGAWTKPAAVQEWARRASERLGNIVEKEVFGRYDLLLTPTVAGRPMKAGKLMKMGTIAAQLASLPSVAYTATWNVSGHPAIALPVGVGSDGLPVSVQLVASREGGEELLLDVAATLEDLLRRN
ncbi:amidase [Corynebacterium resistens DSM 45100]|uniref:amidase n=1 Tax=Corynebacterium resistens (strain DSM 45100 / JCM 12819 / GTC 2026 / SICGH 158) TaxID=662755 RepID=F8E242_CORRG|nr:amidase family protein [Corynebacterium resistens]AEI09359.1 amidase [Corynebacterium resistens DSM 45100]